MYILNLPIQSCMSSALQHHEKTWRLRWQAKIWFASVASLSRVVIIPKKSKRYTHGNGSWCLYLPKRGLGQRMLSTTMTNVINSQAFLSKVWWAETWRDVLSRFVPLVQTPFLAKLYSLRPSIAWTLHPMREKSLDKRSWLGNSRQCTWGDFVLTIWRSSNRELTSFEPLLNQLPIGGGRQLTFENL